MKLSFRVLAIIAQTLFNMSCLSTYTKMEK